MLAWLELHSTAITVLTSIGTFLIWLVYAQLLYASFRRERHARLIINRGSSRDLGAVCIISNMSREPVFLQMLFAVLDTAQGRVVMDITDRENSSAVFDSHHRADDQRANHAVGLKELTFQGPLESGGYLHIGSFNGLIERLARSIGARGDVQALHEQWSLQRLSIHLIATYGPEDYPIGAERAFRLVEDDGELTLRPETWNTLRKTSLRQRNRLKKLLTDFDLHSEQCSATIATK